VIGWAIHTYSWCMPRLRLGLPIALLAVAALAAAALAAPTTTGNRRLARRDAPQLLARLKLPARAERSPSEPGGDGGWLARPASISGTEVVTDNHGWWRITGTTPPAVIAYIEAHPPFGSTPAGVSGSFGGDGFAGQSYTVQWPTRAGRLSSRQLIVEAVNLRDGAVGVRADAEDVWIVTRSPHERVPSGVHEIDVTSAEPAKSPIVSRSVTDPAKVRRIIDLIDRMPVVQPAVYSCPAEFVVPIVTFEFRAAAGGAVLADAQASDYGYPSEPCNPIDFSIGNRAQKPLIGGNFLATVQRMLGVRFR
jgi:hypothetical protein